MEPNLADKPLDERITLTSTRLSASTMPTLPTLQRLLVTDSTDMDPDRTQAPVDIEADEAHFTAGHAAVEAVHFDVRVLCPRPEATAILGVLDEWRALRAG